MSYWTLGRELDQKMFEYRHSGMNGTQEEQKGFLERCFFAARGNARLVLLAAPFLGKSQQELFDVLYKANLEGAARQAEETGFDERQTALYVEAHRKAFESLAEESGLRLEPIAP